MEERVKKTSPAVVALAWLLVGLPWAWGVAELWKNARKLFEAPPPAPTMSAPSSSAPTSAPK